jgi:hypothetical protein
MARLSRVNAMALISGMTAPLSGMRIPFHCPAYRKG